MTTLSYTSVARVYSLEPAIQSVTALTSAQIVDSFATAAEAEINAKLSRLYTVPVTGSPPVLAAIADDLTIYRLLSRRIFPPQRLKDSQWPKAFKEAEALLDKIADGSVPLVNSGGTLIAASTLSALATSNTKDYQPTFHEGHTYDHVQDSDKIDDILSDRGLQ